jgi:hypothetical protein
MTISVGEPKRNQDYQKAHFPKRTTDDTESQAMARFAVVEQIVSWRLRQFLTDLPGRALASSRRNALQDLLG